MALSADHDVTAIDINPVQLDYARSRLAGAPAVTGAAERVMGLGRGAMTLFGWRRAVVERFLALEDAAAQSAYWRTHLDTLGFRLATDTALSLSGLKAVYGSPFLAILPAHFGRVMRARLARCFAAFPNRGNPYARALLLGEPPLPFAFDAGRIALVGGDAADYLEQCAPASFDAFTLSNILDGAAAGFRRRLFAAARRAAAPGATLVLRSFAEPTHPTPYDNAARDRSILWGVVDVRPVAALDEGAGVPIPVIE
jgi:S-adenosylmethionine:diacylglycerol 3-amino-3-carboxypropyl transferase